MPSLPVMISIIGYVMLWKPKFRHVEIVIPSVSLKQEDDMISCSHSYISPSFSVQYY